MSEGFIPAHGGYSNLLSYRKAEIIFDATNHFCRRFIDPRSRTTDQMIQAARSGKQNILEGSMAAGTSKETEIKLTGVARASLEELLADYKDYLRIHDLEVWPKGNRKAIHVRRLGYDPESTYGTYRRYVEQLSPETAANTVICLINQATYLLRKQMLVLEALS